MSGWWKGVHVKDLFNIIHEVHATRKGHIGGKKTLAKVGKIYDYATNSDIKVYFSVCDMLHAWANHKQPWAQLKPIISLGFITKEQVNVCSCSHLT